MATSRIQVTEGSGKSLATNSFSEDAVTKEISRVALNNSSGTEVGTSGNPLQVSLANTGSNSTAISVSLASVPSHAVTNAGTFAVQAAQSGTFSTRPDAYATDDTAMPATPLVVPVAGEYRSSATTYADGDATVLQSDVNGNLKVTLATSLDSTNDSVKALGNVAHDAADSGNPVKIGARAAATLSDDIMVANADRTDAVSDLDGVIITRSQIPLGDLISERVTNTDGASTAFTNFGATASTRSYITAFSVFNSSASTGYIDFRDGTSGSVLYTVPIPAGGGAVMASNVPLFRTSANTALAYDVSAALSTVYISVSGFKSKV